LPPECWPCILKQWKPSPSLPCENSLLVHGISLEEPIRYRGINRKREPFLSKQHAHESAQSAVEIIVLLYVSVFMNRELIIPGNRALLEAVHRRSKEEFAAERSESNVTVGNGGVVLQHDVDFSQLIPELQRSLRRQAMDDIGNTISLAVQSGGKDDPRRVGVDLHPPNSRRRAAEAL